MNPLAILLGFQPTSIPLDTLNDFANKREVGSLIAMTDPQRVPSKAFDFLRTGGVYGGGQAGWRVFELTEPRSESRYVVFSTPLSCEDIGEQVFEWRDGKMVRFVDESETFGLKIDSHDFTVRADPKERRVTIDNVIRLVRRGTPSSALQFRIGPEWSVKQISTPDGQPVPFAQAGGTVSVSTSQPAPFSLKISYESILPERGAEAKMTSRELMLAGACWWPSMGRLASTSRATIIAPASWHAFTHGSRVSTSVNGEWKTTVWSNSVPISVFSLAAGEYKVATQKIGSRFFWTAALDAAEAELKLQNEVNAGVIEFYASLVPWPYPGWGALISELFEGGGLEAYSYATYVKGWLPDIDAHEPAHTLWGGLIPNTYLKSLWNESFATFFENFYLREGSKGNREDLRIAFRDVPDVAPGFRAQPADTAGAATGASALTIGYRRGGLVLDMLEFEIGPTLMRQALVQWLSTHPKGEVGEWADFERIVSIVAKRDMRWFFEQWNRRAGYPEFEISDVSQSGKRMTGTLRFLSTPYRLRMNARVAYTDGTSEWFRLPLTSGRSSETLTLNVAKVPKSVTFDPDQRVMRDYDRSSLPPSLNRAIGAFRPWVRAGDEAMADQLLERRPRNAERELPAELDRKVLVVDPRKSEAARALLLKVSGRPALQGNRLVWRGQAVDLERGGFAALIDLGDGKQCVLMFGRTRLRPALGQASAVLFDDLGRPKAALRRPVESGNLTFELGPQS